MSRTFSHSHINSFRRPIVLQHTKGFNQLKWKLGNFLLFPLATPVWFDCGFWLYKPYPISLHGMCAWSQAWIKHSHVALYLWWSAIYSYGYFMGTQRRPQSFCEERKIKWELGFSLWQSTYWVIRLGYGLYPWGSRGESQGLIAGKASLYFLICPDVGKLTHASSSQETLGQCAMNWCI